jgi:phage regulator Rha-like protein
LRRYSIDNILIKIDELKNEMVQNNQMSDLAFMQATHHRLGAHAPVNNLSDDLLKTIARSAHF